MSHMMRKKLRRMPILLRRARRRRYGRALAASYDLLRFADPDPIAEHIACLGIEMRAGDRVDPITLAQWQVFKARFQPLDRRN